MLNKRNGLTMDRALGVMYGVACGDAIGAPVEFWSAQQIQDTFPGNSRLLAQMQGGCTDDTGLSLALARGLIRCTDSCGIEGPVGDEFIRWRREVSHGIGLTCGFVIDTAANLLRVGHLPATAWGYAALHAERVIGQPSEGNGGLMRCAFVGLYAGSIEDAEALARCQARMTHLGPVNLDACAWYAGTLWAVSRSKRPKHTWNQRLRCLPKQFSPPPVMSNPAGTAEDTLRAVVYVLNRHASLPVAIGTAVRLGGDADTVAALVGAMAGAMSGIQSIPECWREALAAPIRTALQEVVLSLFIR